MNFQIGCDPEIFLHDGSTVKSVIGLIGADKWHPRQLTEDGHAVLEDNVAVEFNIPACSSSDDFIREVTRSMKLIKELLPHHLQYSQESAISFPQTELQHAEAWVFGCEPDFNAWAFEKEPVKHEDFQQGINIKPYSKDECLRSAGGHVHVGSNIAQQNPTAMIKAMDLFLGVPSIELDEHGTLRRELYGKAGAFRPKPYGVEYRTLSNFWIFSDKLLNWVYTNTAKALQFVAAGNVIDTQTGKLIQECINKSDKQLCKMLMNKYAL